MPAIPPTVSPVRHLTIDGDVGLSDEEARRLARIYFFAGFLALPLLWFVNCYYFWPVLRHGGDTVILNYVRFSAVGFALISAIFLPWVLSYAFGGEALFGTLYKKLLLYSLAEQWQTWLR
eukprot:TRINITY_DN533_c0_g1_i1.p2 TRINITY_DN533_c0_g1~~TRINITY_DN533_c0_g1_i1.p2  ORF type:complete len:120 (+),score=14.01 TRINITY_DN533_c0_g1_i1:427-786(+)